MAKYKITIEELKSVEEVVTVYENKHTKEQIESIYSIDSGQRVDWERISRPTGKIILNSTEVFSQIADMDDIKGVVKAVNGLKE